MVAMSSRLGERRVHGHPVVYLERLRVLVADEAVEGGDVVDREQDHNDGDDGVVEE